jgi:hypothetical protein
MNKKLNNMPGFTAGASLYKAEGHYYTHSVSNQVGAAILPALAAGPGGDCLDACTERRCGDLDGEAFQRCVKRCSRICFPTGPFVHGCTTNPIVRFGCWINAGRCWSDCLSDPNTRNDAACYLICAIGYHGCLCDFGD